MKFKGSKKIVSLFLAVLMVVTSVPSLAMTAFAGTDNCKYLFAYFTGNTKNGQNVRFALSEDGYTFTALNNNEPVLTQTQGSGTSAGYARDPYITRDPNGNGFYMVATDMDASGIHSSWSGDSCVYVWHSTNLVDWTQIADFDFQSFGGDFASVIRAWAPQIIWDSTTNQWMMYLSITMSVNNATEWNVMYYTYTTDFQTFTTPQKFEFSTGVYTGRIDADIVSNNGTYYMYYKDESAAAVMLATSDSLTGTYTPVKTVSTTLSSNAVEGNAMYQLGNSDTWVMMLDEYSKGSFAYGTTTDFTNFTKYTGSTSANSALNARHGSVMQITTEEYNRLKTATFNSAAEPTGEGVDLTENLVGQYLTTSDVTADASGKGNTLTQTGTVSWNNTGYSSEFGAASFTNGNYLSTSNFKSIIGDSATGFTISFLGYKDSANDDEHGRFVEVSNYSPKSYTWVSGETDMVYLSNWANNNYEYIKDTYLWQTGRFGGSAGEQAAASWHLYTIVYDSTTKNLRMYVDGSKSVDDTNDKLDSSFLSALTTLNIACTCYPDNTLTGMLRDMRVYNRAITDDEASRLPKQYQLDGETEKKQYVIDNIGNPSRSYSFNTLNYNADDTYMKNLVYSGDWGDSDWTTFSDYNSSNSDNKHNMKVVGPSISVGVYSGSGTDIRFPMIAQTGQGKAQSGVSNYIGIDHLAYSSGNFSVGGSTWARCKSWNDLTSDSDTSHDFSSAADGGVNRSENTADGRFELADNKYWKNYMKYNGSGNTTTYYDLLSNPSFAYQADYTWSWSKVFSTGWGSKSNYTGTVNATNQKFYVLNYAPLKTLLESDAFKSNFQNVVDNEWKYDETSLAKFYSMYYDMLRFDLTVQDYSTESAVQGVASTIKSYVEDYFAEPDLKVFNVNFIMADNTTVTKTVTAGNTIDGLILDNTVAKDNNNGTHEIYSWPSECVATYMPKSDVTFNEVSSTRNCTFDEGTTVDGIKTKTCTVCGYKTTELDLDTSAYDAAVAEATSAINNTAKYTADSLAALQEILDANKVENANSQTELDAMTKKIKEAIETLALNEYTVNLYYVIDDLAEETPHSTLTGKYGEDFTLTCDLGDGYTVSKWVKSTDSVDEKVGANNNSLSSRYYGNVNYYVYATKVKSAKEDSAIISLTDKSNRVVDNTYVTLTDGAASVNVTFDITNKTVTVDNYTLTAVDSTFYSIVGFKINGTEYKSSDSITLDITGDVTIETIYESAKSFSITSSDGSCTPSVGTAYWDKLVSVSAENTSDTTKWYVNGVYTSTGASYSFRACQDADIKCVNDESAVKATATVQRLSYNDPTEKTITVVGSFSVPSDCTVVEKGVLMKTTSQLSGNSLENVLDINKYVGDNANARKFVATNYVKSTNQYAINVYSSKAYTNLTVGAVAYVVYKDADGNQKTEYSELKTFTQA